MNQFTFDFNTKRKPSKALIMRTIGVALEKGADEISLTWGENWMDFKFSDMYGGTWMGFGWMKDISASDIADELNAMRKEAQSFIKDHFIFVRVGC